MSRKKFARVAKALLREGVQVEKEGPIYRIRRGNGPDAEVLLAEGFELETKAVVQLMNFASASHPLGGHVCRVCATPDFHPGPDVPVGSIVATTTDMVIPQAVGTDINCGMRMHVTGIPVDEFRLKKEALIKLLHGDLLLGSRDLPMTINSLQTMFDAGASAWLDRVAQNPLGMLQGSDLAQVERELPPDFVGNKRWAPERYLDNAREVVRDGYFGTIGGSNHFVEFQVVDEISDGHLARNWNLKKGEVAFMVHTGSRTVGRAIGIRWNEIAKERWPKQVRYPKVFPLHGKDALEYVEAMNTAANYGAVNRLLLAEIVRLRLREVFGDLETPLVHDAPHNLVFHENDTFIHRKGATPAHVGQPVLIPGSMGHPSHVLVGMGNERFLNSASHGAGRAITRFEMDRKRRMGDDLQLEGVECITLKEERKIEEAPVAYKDIGPVVRVQTESGLARSVARTSPLVTFKA